ncbi:hypothetical protein ACA910_015858 [Epithemia clementina (nom. ined.)]
MKGTEGSNTKSSSNSSKSDPSPPTPGSESTGSNAATAQAAELGQYVSESDATAPAGSTVSLAPLPAETLLHHQPEDQKNGLLKTNEQKQSPSKKSSSNSSPPDPDPLSSKDTQSIPTSTGGRDSTKSGFMGLRRNDNVHKLKNFSDKSDEASKNYSSQYHPDDPLAPPAVKVADSAESVKTSTTTNTRSLQGTGVSSSHRETSSSNLFRPPEEKSMIPEKSGRIRLPLPTMDQKGKATKSPAPQLVTLPEEEELSERAAMAPLLPLSESGLPQRDAGPYQQSQSELLVDVGNNGEDVVDKNNQEGDDQDTKPSTIAGWLCDVYKANEFVILILASILLARVYPPLGARYLAPKITAGWIYVCIIFVLAGVGLKTEEFAKAFQQIWFNLFVQIFNFGFVSAGVYGGCWGLENAGVLSQDLADGMVVCACLPTTINMILVLSKAAGGDESLAIVNAAAGNMIGVFLSPVLILGYLGVKGDVNLVSVFYKLALRVVLPVMVGQVIQKTMPRLMAYQKKHKKQFRKFQEYCLCFIVYTVFCRTFEDGTVSSIADIFVMIAFVFLFLLLFMILAWVSSGVFFRNHPEMRVVALFGCTQKTVSMGIPVINSIYEESPAIGLYTLPLLIWHPMQLVLGSFLAPYLDAFVEREKVRLGRADEDTSSSSPGWRRAKRTPAVSRPNNNDGDKGGGGGGDGDLENSSSTTSTLEMGDATRKNKMTPKANAFSRITRFEGGGGSNNPDLLPTENGVST